MTTVKRTVHVPVSKIVKASQKAGTLAVAKAGASRAKVLSAIDTGQMRNSVDAESRSNTQAVYGASAEHAIYQEFGTSKMKAQPFLRPSADWLRKVGATIYAKVLGRALRNG